jgi:hypothetical protein
MATQAEIETRLEAVRALIAKGVRSNQFADRSVSYAKLEELRQIERELAAQLAARPKQTLLVANKGFV